MNHSTLTPEMQELVSKLHEDQDKLAIELKEIYALVDVSRLALVDLRQSETDSCNAVLFMVINRLFALMQQVEATEKELELMAYPTTQGGAA